MADQARTIIWIDSNGFTNQTLVRSNPDASTIQAKMLLHTNADVLNWWEGPPNINSTPTTLSGLYVTVGDQARLLFLDTAGSLVTFNLPAPLLSCFLADGVTVDPSAIADLIAAIIADGQSSAGNSIASFVAGNLRRTKVLI
jgi:hypothetical protein